MASLFSPDSDGEVRRGLIKDLKFGILRSFLGIWGRVFSVALVFGKRVVGRTLLRLYSCLESDRSSRKVSPCDGLIPFERTTEQTT